MDWDYLKSRTIKHSGDKVSMLGIEKLLTSGTKIHLVDRELSGRVLDSRGRRFEPHRRHCVGVLEQDTFIIA